LWHSAIQEIKYDHSDEENLRVFEEMTERHLERFISSLDATDLAELLWFWTGTDYLKSGQYIKVYMMLT
jgi:hypothetical protein